MLFNMQLQTRLERRKSRLERVSRFKNDNGNAVSGEGKPEEREERKEGVGARVNLGVTVSIGYRFLASQSKRLKLNYTMTYEKNFPLLWILLHSAFFPPPTLSLSSSLWVCVKSSKLFSNPLGYVLSTNQSLLSYKVLPLPRRLSPSLSSSLPPLSLWGLLLLPSLQSYSLCVTHNYAVIDIFYSGPFSSSPYTLPYPLQRYIGPAVILSLSSEFWGVATFQKKHKFVTPFDGPLFEGTARYRHIVLRSSFFA